MAVTMAWGGSYTVLMEVGYLSRFFTLANYGTPVTRTNLVTNPNFEVDLTGWGAAGTVARTTAQSYSGVASASMTYTGAGIVLIDQPTRPVVTAGLTYTASFYMKQSVDSGLVICNLMWYDAGGSLILDDSHQSNDPNTVWQRFSYTRTAPANAVSCSFRVYQFNGEGGGAVATVNYVDAVLVEQASTALPYFDGTYADPYSGYGLETQSWSGTANASTSTSSWRSGILRKNLCINPSFEADPTGIWGGYQATITRVLGTLGTGSWVGQAVATVTGVGGFFNSFKAVGGTTYTASLTGLRVSGSRTYKLQFEFYNGATYLGGASTMSESFATAKRVSWTFTAPATTTVAYIVCYSVGTGSIGDTFQIDDVLIEEASSLLPYFDGNNIQTRSNLMTNPSAENTFTGWGNSGGTLTQSSTYAYSGTYSARTETVSNGAVDVNTGLFPIVANQAYVASAYVRSSVSRQCRVYIAWYNGGTFLSNSIGSYVTSSTSGWTRCTVSGTAPATATIGYLVLQVASSVIGDLHYWDAFLVETGSTLNNYYEGKISDYNGYELQNSKWEGTVNGSVSVANWFTTTYASGSLLDGTDTLGGTLEGIDVTQYVESIDISRGRSDQLQDFSAGTCSLVLNNNDRRFDPVNASSPYVNPSTGKSGVTPRRKVTVKHGTTSLFTGRITDIDLEYVPNPSTQSRVKVDAADDFVLLASTKIASFTPPSELSGARVSRVLDLAEVNFPATARSISAGTATLAANIISDNTTALTYLMKVATTEQGYMYIKGDGTLVYTNKQIPAFAPSVFTFADDGTGTNYSALTIQYGSEFLYNKVTAQTETGLPQTVDDASSQSEFGISTLVQSDLLFNSDTDALVLANYLLNLYKQPAYRFDSVQVDFAGNTVSLATQNSIVALDMSSVITVTKTYQNGTPTTVSQVLTIEGIKHTITPIGHSIQFGLANANVVFPWKLDDAIYGKLDTTNALS